MVSYITVNVSSPNTPGLRNLQEAKSLDDLLARVIEVRDRVRAHAGPTPLLLKIAPDLTLADLDDLVGVAREREVDGMIVGNTTLSRPPIAARTRKVDRAGRACPASRYSRCRRGCWRKPMCGWKTRCR